MDLEIQVLPPDGKKLHQDLATALSTILGRLQVPFEIKDNGSGAISVIVLDSTDSECRFILRILQRAGYNAAISLS
jgi:hypothetical protein